jgi:hypothetical protein
MVGVRVRVMVGVRVGFRARVRVIKFLIALLLR